MKKYYSYKDSGIEWIGEIPSHWEVKRFGHLFSFSRGLGITKKDLKEEGIPCVNYGEIHSKFGFSVDPENHKLKCVEESYLETADKSLLKRGDFVFADTSEDIEGSGNFTVLDSDLPTFAGYHTVIARHENGNHYKYLAYCFDSLEFRNQIRSAVSGIKVFSITQAILKSSKVQLPSYPEQTAIATYLDRKTAEIDELIADKKRLLELYEEEKTAVINQAVTKGINPDVPMKDSGIEWLGEIPEHWVVKRFKHVTTKIGDGIHSTPSYLQGTEIYFINGVNLNSGEISLTDKTLSVSIEEYDKFKIDLKQGSILISLNGTIGKLAFYNNEKVILGKSAAYIELKDLVYNKFIYYVLKSQYINNYFEDSFSGTTIKNLSLYTLRNTPFPFMEFEEQQTIVHHIETECKRIDTQVERTKKLIELLKEYREALISEVVTGKIKVA